MTTTEAINLTRSRAEGRTRYEGQDPRVDELLLAEIERLGRVCDAMETLAFNDRETTMHDHDFIAAVEKARAAK